MKYKLTDKCVLEEVRNEAQECFNKNKALLKKSANMFDEVIERINIENKKINKRDYRAYLVFDDHESIDTFSDAFIDLDSTIATPPILCANHITPRDISLNGERCKKVEGGYTASSVNIKCFLDKEINNIVIDIISKKGFSYVIKTDNGEVSSFELRRADISLQEYKGNVEVSINFEEETNFIIRDVSFLNKKLKDSGYVVSREFKVYKDVSKINVESIGDKCSYLLGVYNKDIEDYMYMDASSTVSVISDKANRKNATGATPGFGEPVYGLKRVMTIPSNANKDSIKVYRGYNRFDLTIVRGAMVNEDMTSIEYNHSNIAKSEYVDIDNLILDMSAGDLIILKQKINLVSAIRLKETIIDNNEVKCRITIGDKSILSNSIFTEIEKGLSDVTICLYKKKKDDTDTSSTKVDIDFNMRKHCNLIYSERMKEDVIHEVILSDELYAISDSVLVKSIKEEDSFLITYDENGEDSYRFEDGEGKYIRVTLKAIFNSNKAYLKTMTIK